MTIERDPVRRRTAAAVLRRIDDDTIASLIEHDHAGRAVVDDRLHALEREWDVDRTIEAEASTMGLLGLALGVFVDRRLLALPTLVAASLLMYAGTRRYPLLPLFRRLGVRSAREIARERYALKALRGDFAELDAEVPTSRSRALGAAPAEASSLERRKPVPEMEV
jgi:hypothetical protein